MRTQKGISISSVSVGNKTRIVTDKPWQALLDRGHAPGQYKRWFLRALQQEFDSRLRPDGWDAPGFQPDALWTPASI
jgi:alpha-L-rhamnosidase